jgi:hypothetical protein
LTGLSGKGMTHAISGGDRLMSKASNNRRARAKRTLLRLAMGWQADYGQQADSEAVSADLQVRLLGHSRAERIRLKHQALALELCALGPPSSFEPAWWWEPSKFAAFTGSLAITLSAPRVRGAIRRSSVLQLVKELGNEGFEKALAVPESFSYLAETSRPAPPDAKVQSALLLALSAIRRQSPLLGARLATLHLGPHGPGMLHEMVDLRAANLLDTLAAEAALT